MINKIINKYQKEGLVGIFAAIYRRIVHVRVKSYLLFEEIVSSNNGIEIGGTSSIFEKRNMIPVYPFVHSLDNCNFSSNTVWEGKIEEGLKYFYDKKHLPGRQYVLEATDLCEIEDDRYDFLLSSHMIEHTANPIKALKEWLRIVKENGHLILVVPHKDATFDHNRPVTTLEHLIQDYDNNMTEEDLTHMNEILELHDLSMDVEAGNYEQFVERSKKNYQNRCFHHHVFNSLLVAELMDYLNVKIRAIEAVLPMHIVVIAQKLPNGHMADNKAIFEFIRSSEYQSPFPSDAI